MSHFNLTVLRKPFEQLGRWILTNVKKMPLAKIAHEKHSESVVEIEESLVPASWEALCYVVPASWA